VNAGVGDFEFMVSYTQSMERVGNEEPAIGWYSFSHTDTQRLLFMIFFFIQVSLAPWLRLLALGY